MKKIEIQVQEDIIRWTLFQIEAITLFRNQLGSASDYLTNREE